MAGVAGTAELESKDGIHKVLAALQEKTAFLPDYSFKSNKSETPSDTEVAVWPAVDGGTSASGIIGGSMTLGLAGLAGFTIYAFKRRKNAKASA